jgi:hypothetical protein
MPPINPKPKTKLGQKAAQAGYVRPKPLDKPVWKGPEIDGVTQSLLGRFLVCRERFRLLVVEGLQPNENWNARLGYGNMWHACEEAWSERPGDEDHWVRTLLEHAKKEAAENRLQQREIQKWYNICLRQFPTYLEYWRETPDEIARKPILQEQVFSVAHPLPSGRTVVLRGKWDGVSVIESGEDRGIWLDEHKSKGYPDEQKIRRQLSFDLQTMLYLVALMDELERGEMLNLKKIGRHSLTLRGVRYNVVRRPLAGGKGTIVQGEPRTRKPKNKAEREIYGETVNVPGETDEEYYERAAAYWREDPAAYFFRWSVAVSPADVQKFRTQTLDPLLESLCDWWEVVGRAAVMNQDPFDPSVNKGGVHFRTPFGFYNVLAEGGFGDVDSYLESGSEVGLKRVSNLFPELT